MQVEIIKILTGPMAIFYTIKLDGETLTLFEKFIIENKSNHSTELKNISERIQVMSKKTGARENFFKINEGEPGDGVCALYDDPDKNLRLYCVRYGSVVVILGNGGEKPKHMRALQESTKLTKENDIVKRISKGVTKAFREKYIRWAANEMDIECDDDEIIIDI